MRADDLSAPDERQVEERLSAALSELAPDVLDAGVWPALQPRVHRARRRRALARAAAALVVVVLALAGWQAFRAVERDPVASKSTVTHPAAPNEDATPATAPPTPGTTASVLLVHDTTDRRVELVRRWAAALQAGDVSTAWDLLDTKTRKFLGGSDALGAENTQFGQWWALSEDVQYQVIDGADYGRSDLAVVTFFGTIPVGDAPYWQTQPFLIVDEGDEGLRVGFWQPFAPGPPAGAYEPLRILSPGMDLPVQDSSVQVYFALPAELALSSARPPAAGGPIVLALDGTLIRPGDWTLTTVAGRQRGAYGPVDLEPGEHVLTLVQFRDDGAVDVQPRMFSVPTMTAPGASGVSPYHEEDTFLAAMDVINAYMRAVLEGDRAALEACLTPADAGLADGIFAAERARMRAGSREMYAGATDITYNFWQDGEWYLPWSPPPQPSTAAQAELAGWLQEDPATRLVASVYAVDASSGPRSFALEKTADGVRVKALGQTDLEALDLLGHTPPDVIETYLAALQAGNYSAAYDQFGNPELDRAAYLAEMNAAGETLTSYRVGDWQLEGDDLATVVVDASTAFARDGHTADAVGERWRVERVGGFWKVGWLPRQ